MDNTCSNCGSEILSVNHLYCGKCGAKQSAINEDDNQNVYNSDSSNLKTENTENPSKVAAIAFLVGLIGFSGVGHIYIGRKGLGIGLMLLGWLMVVLSFTFVPASLLIYFGYLVLLTIDAYRKAKSPTYNHKKPKPTTYMYKPSYNHAASYNSPKIQSQPLSSGAIKGIVVLIVFIIWLVMGAWSGLIVTWQFWIFLPILLVAAITGKRKDMRRARYYAGSDI